MTLKSSRCSDEIYREPLLYRKKEFRSSVITVVDSSLNSSVLPANTMCSIPASEDGFNLNKQRKLDEEYDPLLENGNMRDNTARNFMTTGCISSPVHNADDKSHLVTLSVEFPAGSHLNVNNGQPSTASSMPPYISHNIKDAWECLLPDRNAVKPATELTSARDLCISILMRERDIFRSEDSQLSRTSSPIDRDDNQNSPLFECMKCSLMENPSKMLICDCCDGAFHLSCCNPRVKKIPEGEWYCLACKRKKPKRQRGKLTNPKGPKGLQRPRRGLGPIRDMLVDSESYESEVRIGSNFQAEVPEWSGCISSNFQAEVPEWSGRISSEDQFAEPTELNPSETTMLGDTKIGVGNWIQCREVLDTGVVCGKWRRAPLFVVQSSNWDCSCSVVWDPIHADCAVPQELETGQVLEQLKYINKLKDRLRNSNRKC